MLRAIGCGLAACLWVFATFQHAPAQAPSDPPLARIAFGSCVHQDRPQPIWKAVLNARPQLFLFLGDNIYGDTDDMAVLKAKYDKQFASPGCRQLLATCPVLAVWDDHDYGRNDAGADYPHKVESQRVFLDAFSEPADSPRRSQKGVYVAREFGPPEQRVQVILLDGRYFRSPLRREGRSYVPNTQPDATMLGDEQWRWLEDQLRKPAKLRLIGSGIQVVAEDHPFEKWANFPVERERLFRVIRSTQATGVVLLSGDRHHAELSVMDAGLGYPLYDLTSSGLNMAGNEMRLPEPNRHRLALMNRGHNFGLVTVEWSAADPIVALEIRDEVGDVTIRRKLPLSELSPSGRALPPAVAAVNQPQRPEGVLTVEEAAKKLNENCTLEMRVMSSGQTGDGGTIFLNSALNFRDAGNFTVVVRYSNFRDKMPNLDRDTYRNRVVRVSGKVTLFKEQPQIVVTDPAQIQIVER